MAVCVQRQNFNWRSYYILCKNQYYNFLSTLHLRVNILFKTPKDKHHLTSNMYCPIFIISVACGQTPEKRDLEDEH